MANQKHSQYSVTGAEKENQGNPLDQFLRSIEHFVKRVGEISAEAAPHNEHKIIIRANAELLVAQTGKLTAIYREAGKNLSEQQRNDLNTFLRVQNVEHMTTTGLKAYSENLPPIGSSKGGILAWIQFIFREIKKIWFAISDFLGWAAATVSIISTILLLLDEIIIDIATFLGISLGMDGGRISKAFSQSEVNYLTEMTALTTWRNAINARTPRQEED
jgi:hypothetical protein